MLRAGILTFCNWWLRSNNWGWEIKFSLWPAILNVAPSRNGICMVRKMTVFSSGYGALSFTFGCFCIFRNKSCSIILILFSNVLCFEICLQRCLILKSTFSFFYSRDVGSTIDVCSILDEILNSLPQPLFFPLLGKSRSRNTGKLLWLLFSVLAMSPGFKPYFFKLSRYVWHPQLFGLVFPSARTDTDILK